MNNDDFIQQLDAVSERVLSKALTIEDATNYSESLFESIRHINEYGEEFWYARELQAALEYTEWRNFKKVIDKAMLACETSDNLVLDHFVDVNKTIEMPKTATKTIDDMALSRYACYLIVQNGDPRKKVIALGQTYFAVKTRQQELIENFEALDEDTKRLAIRKEMIEHNKLLVAAAKDSGVETQKDYAIFQNAGYKGLYGGLTAGDIKSRRNLGKNENIQGKENANAAHYEVGKAVRDTIKGLGGTMPEDLPTPTKSIKQIEREQKKRNEITNNQ